MSQLTSYVYYNAAGLRTFVDSNDFVSTGTWSAYGSYVADRDAATYGSTLYMTTITNVGANPLAPITMFGPPRKWAPMVVLYEYQGTTAPAPSGDGTAIALEAYALAQIGTNTGTAAYNLAQSAYNLATTAGGSTAAEAYLLAVTGTYLAQSAYYLAQIGTNTGTAAYNLAASAQSTANGAFSIAVSGTNAAASAQSVAGAAYALAQIGTNTGTAAYTLAQSASDLAQSAYYLAQIGTNTGTAAYNLATSGSNVAWAAYVLALAGTTAPAPSGDGTAIALEAYALAQIGTNTGTAAYNLAASAQSTANGAFSIAVAGTNAASSAYALAQIGTNTGTAAYNLATSGSNVAWAAYVLALAGTSSPNYSAGGTMTGNLKVPNLVVGTGTVPVSSAVSGTIYYDMSGPAYQLTTATSGFQVSAKNSSNGAEVCAVILSDGTQRSITYDGNFSWFGTQVPFTPLAVNKKVLVALSCISASGSGILGATSIQT